MCLFAMVGLFFFHKNDIFRDTGDVDERNERISKDAGERTRTVRSTKPRSNFSLFHIGFL